MLFSSTAYANNSNYTNTTITSQTLPIVKSKSIPVGCSKLSRLSATAAVCKSAPVLLAHANGVRTLPQPPRVYTNPMNHSHQNHQAQENFNRPLPVTRPEGKQGIFMLIIITIHFTTPNLLHVWDYLGPAPSVLKLNALSPSLEYKCRDFIGFRAEKGYTFLITTVTCDNHTQGIT